MQDAVRIIFRHIPKTAGTSMKEVIYRNVGEDAIRDFGGDTQALVQAFLDLPQHERDRYLWYIGNLAGDFHEHLAVPATYVAMIRRPEKRVVSLYKHISRRKDNRDHAAVAAMSLTEFLKSYPKHQVENNYVRRFVPQGSGLSHDMDVEERHLDMAIQAIDKQYLLVGLVERFPETAALCGRVFGFPNTEPVTKNVAVGHVRLSNDELAEATAWFNERNAFDHRFYQAVAERFDRMLERYGLADSVAVPA